MKPPLISICIPTFNRPDLCIRAIKSALNQDYANFEVVVSDNSDNHNKRKLELFCKNKNDLKYKQTPSKLSMSENWDNVVNLSSGEYFLLLSDDDYFTFPDSVSKFSKQIDKSSHGFIFSNVVIEKNEKKFFRKHTRNKIFKTDELLRHHYIRNFPIFPCSTLVKRSDFNNIGGYTNFSTDFAVDAELWIRLLDKYDSAKYLAEPLVTYFSHSSISNNHPDIWKKDIKKIDILCSNLRNISNETAKLLANTFKKELNFIDIYNEYKSIVTNLKATKIHKLIYPAFNIFRLIIKHKIFSFSLGKVKARYFDSNRF